MDTTTTTTTSSSSNSSSHCEYLYLREVGLGGVLLNAILAGYAMWKALAYIFHTYSTVCKDPSLRFTRSVFHVLLVLAALMDMPLYVGFCVTCDYVQYAYAFHKLEAPVLFAALSLTVSIWSRVLYDLRGIYELPFLLRHWSLVTINIIFCGMALVTFVDVCVSGSVNDFAKTMLYTAMNWVQIACQILLTSLMLHLGLKLSIRLKGVAWGNNPKNQSPFKTALKRLNTVMAVCLLCVIIQCTLLILNFVLSDPHKSDSFFMDPVLYFALVYWVPQTGWCLGLSWLHRNPERSRSMSVQFHGNAPAHTCPTLQQPTLEKLERQQPSPCNSVDEAATTNSANKQNGREAFMIETSANSLHIPLLYSSYT